MKWLHSQLFFFLLLLGMVGALPHVCWSADFWAEGRQAFDEANWTEAERIYNEAGLTLPNNPELHFNQGAVLYQQERYLDAEALFKKALATDDSSQEAKTWYNLGNTYVKQEKWEEGLEAYKRSLEMNPDNPDAQYNLEWTQKKIQEALDQQKDSQENPSQQSDQQKSDQEPSQEEKGQKTEEGAEGQQQDSQSDSEKSEEAKAGEASEELINEEEIPKESKGEPEEMDPEDSVLSGGEKSPESEEAQEDTKEDEQSSGLTQEEAERLLNRVEDESRQKPRRLWQKDETGNGTLRYKDW